MPNESSNRGSSRQMSKQTGISQAGSSQAGGSQAGGSQVAGNQAGSSQLGSSQEGSSLGKRKGKGTSRQVIHDAQHSGDGTQHSDVAHGQLAVNIIQDVVPIVRELVAIARKTRGCELELRFGKIRNNKFEPGITRCMTDDFITRLQTNVRMTTDEWNEFVDFFYPVQRGGKKLVARSRVSYDTNYFNTNQSHCFKTKLKNIVISVLQHDIAFKLELSQEEPFETYDMPQIANPTFVRIQQRRCFLHGGVPNDANWKYDFSMTWHADTKTEAELRQRQQEPSFEFEIELNGKQYFERHDDEHVAQSFLMKALDFVGRRCELQIVSNNL